MRLYDRAFWRGLGAILLTWLLLLATMRALQAAGLDFGFKTWAFGETRNWLSFLMDGTVEAAQAFWRFDSRNPLSPWWYIPLRGYILHNANAFQILHLLTSLLLAVAAYLALSAIGEGRVGRLPLGLGCTCAVFLSNSRLDSIHWNFVGALALSLLCLWCFSEHLRRRRAQASWLAASLVLWLAAVQSYSLQSGAILAIGLLSLRDRWRASGISPRTVAGVAGDVAPFLATFAMFVLIWRTTSVNGITESLGGIDPERLASTLAQGIWHRDYATYIATAGQIGGRLLWIVVPVLALAALAIQLVASRGGSDGAISLPRVLFILLVGGCLAVPTIWVEASSGLFPPGTRWAMLQQFWAPLLAMSLVAAGLALSAAPARAAGPIWTLAITAAVVGAIVISLGLNRQQVLISRAERALITALVPIVQEDRVTGQAFPRYYLIRVPRHVWVPSDYVGRAYAKTALPGLSVAGFRYARLMPDAAAEIVLGATGVENLDRSRSEPVPYAEVGALAWDGTALTRLDLADPASFAGTNAAWRRKP